MISVSSTEFQFAHGTKPRGMGHWAFYFGRLAEPVFYPYSLYSAALTRAKAHAREIGATSIKVAS